MEPKRAPKIPMVCVAWHDASYGDFREMDPQDPPKPIGQIQWSVGWLIRDDTEGIVLGVELSEYDGGFRHMLEIPRPYVKEMRRLSYKRGSTPSNSDHARAEDPPSEDARSAESS